MKFHLGLTKLLKLPTSLDFAERILQDTECKVAADIGCGSGSLLSVFKSRLTTVGIDAHPAVIEAAKAANTHSHYIVADVLQNRLDDILSAHNFNGRKFDLVTLLGVIEHFPKKLGFDLLERCERLTSKYIMLETPNGFVEQGPEFGNEFQRHLSGWFPHDFEGLGYKVYGATGTKYLRGYAAGMKYNFRGAGYCDLILANLLHATRNPKHAFNLIAIKDVRGVPARLG
jgi:SAM-dependent methyltransferase